MAKNDYFVIVYQVLSYLYQCLKNGKKVDPEMLLPGSYIIPAIDETYWRYVLVNILESELATGYSMEKPWGDKLGIPIGLENAIITPKGIEYLHSNGMMQKVKQFAKNALELAPLALSALK